MLEGKIRTLRHLVNIYLTTILTLVVKSNPFNSCHSICAVIAWIGLLESDSWYRRISSNRPSRTSRQFRFER
jgi:hypothetical protein